MGRQKSSYVTSMCQWLASSHRLSLMLLISAGVKVSNSDGVLNFLCVAFIFVPVFYVTKASPREADVFPFLSPEVPTSNLCLDWTSHLLVWHLPGHSQSIFVLFSVELGCFYSCRGLQRAGTNCLGTLNSLRSIGMSCSSVLHPSYICNPGRSIIFF